MLATPQRRRCSWRNFWRGFAEGILLAAITVLVMAVIAWQTVLPSIGILWLAGLL